MRYMCTHTFPAGQFTADQLREMSLAAQQDANIKGYRSFANLKQGKAVCVMEANDEKTLAEWFKRVGMPYDSITPVELEGERGNPGTGTESRTSSAGGSCRAIAAATGASSPRRGDRGGKRGGSEAQHTGRCESSFASRRSRK